MLHAIFRPRTASEVRPVTIDDELTLLDDSVRRLKVEYDIFFGGGSKKPPNDTDWRVQSLVRKYSDGRNMNFAQRFRYNTIVQRYAIYSDLWRQKLKIKEEGYRRPQDALLAIQGLRVVEEEAPAAGSPEAPSSETPQPFRAEFTSGEPDGEGLRALYEAMRDAQRLACQTVSGDFEQFQRFIHSKTEQIRAQRGCIAVEYSVETEDGKVRLKAKPKTSSQ